MLRDKVTDPYDRYDMEQILDLDVRDFKHYQVHQNFKTQRKLDQICDHLRTRPEVTRANLSLFFSALTVVCMLVVTVFTLRGG